jgi:hypothetical protein
LTQLNQNEKQQALDIHGWQGIMVITKNSLYESLPKNTLIKDNVCNMQYLLTGTVLSQADSFTFIL